MTYKIGQKFQSKINSDTIVEIIELSKTTAIGLTFMTVRNIKNKIVHYVDSDVLDESFVLIHGLKEKLKLMRFR